jgi:hypothetical protein
MVPAHIYNTALCLLFTWPGERKKNHSILFSTLTATPCNIHETASLLFGSCFSSYPFHLTIPHLCEALGEADNNILEFGLEVLAERTLLVDSREQLALVAPEVVEEVGFPCEDLGNWHVIEVTVDTGVDERHHLVDGHGAVLLLLKELGKTLTTVQGLLGGGIEIGTELCEGSDLTVLCQEELEGTGDLLHGLELGSGTDTGHGKTDVDRRADTLVEELGLQEDLTVGDGNDVGWDVSGHITTLGLDDGQSSERTTTVLLAHLGGTLEETRVEVEDTYYHVSNALLSKVDMEYTHSPG